MRACAWQVLAAESAEEELAAAAGAAAAAGLVVGVEPNDKDLKPFHTRYERRGFPKPWACEPGVKPKRGSDLCGSAEGARRDCVCAYLQCVAPSNPNHS